MLGRCTASFSINAPNVFVTPWQGKWSQYGPFFNDLEEIIWCFLSRGGFSIFLDLRKRSDNGDLRLRSRLSYPVFFPGNKNNFIRAKTRSSLHSAITPLNSWNSSIRAQHEVQKISPFEWTFSIPVSNLIIHNRLHSNACPWVCRFSQVFRRDPPLADYEESSSYLAEELVMIGPTFCIAETAWILTWEIFVAFQVFSRKLSPPLSSNRLLDNFLSNDFVHTQVKRSFKSRELVNNPYIIVHLEKDCLYIFIGYVFFCEHNVLQRDRPIAKNTSHWQL